jgi:hypothetical protein
MHAQHTYGYRSSCRFSCGESVLSHGEIQWLTSPTVICHAVYPALLQQTCMHWGNVTRPFRIVEWHQGSDLDFSGVVHVCWSLGDYRGPPTSLPSYSNILPVIHKQCAYSLPVEG